MKHLTVVYYFSSKEMDLIEVKRTDLDIFHHPLNKIYKWLVISKKVEQITELEFVSTQRDEEKEVRTFREGDLQFNLKVGELTYNGDFFLVNRMDAYQVSPDLIQKIAGFMKMDAEVTP